MEPQLQPQLQTQTQPPLPADQTTSQPQQNIYKVRIKNIHKWVDNTDLAKTFSEQLNLTPVKVKIDMYGPKSLEKGWAEFKTTEEASKALLLTGFTIRDQALQVIPFVDELPPPKKEKQVKKPNNNNNNNNKQNKHVTPASGDPAQNNNQTQPQNKKPNNKNKDKIRAVNASQVALVSQQDTASNSTTQPNQNNPKTTNPKKKVKEIPVYEEEFERLRAKYKTFKIESTNPRTISLTLPPSDPDFPYDLEGLLLIITLPPSYPKDPCILKVINPDDEVTPRIKKNIEAAVLKRAQTAYLGKPMLAGILFWLDRNMEQVLVDKLTTDDFKLARMGIEVVVNATAKPPPMRQITTNPDQPPLVIAPPTPATTPAPATTAPTTTAATSEDSSTEPTEEQPSAPTQTITTALKGTRIKFEEVSLVNVGILECVLLNVIVSCEKCRNRFDVMNLIKGSQWTDVCEKCCNPCSVGLRPEIMHEYSNILGYLDVEGCALFDILPSSFKAACFECNGSVMFKDHQYSETKTEKNCMQCHQKIAIAISRPTFTKIKAKRATVIIDPAVLEAKKKRKNRDPNDLLIKPGQPLPNQGTCKHYKHSHRWLRFPCCGKAFPCDICHEIQTNSEHESKWANRMICGFCSREQTYSQKPCVACGGDTAGTTTTRFWEGGDGCRDKSKMSSKDAHKFKNSVLKTHSKKASRVGPKKE